MADRAGIELAFLPDQLAEEGFWKAVCCRGFRNALRLLSLPW